MLVYRSWNQIRTCTTCPASAVGQALPQGSPGRVGEPKRNAQVISKIYTQYEVGIEEWLGISRCKTKHLVKTKWHVVLQVCFRNTYWITFNPCKIWYKGHCLTMSSQSHNESQQHESSTWNGNVFLLYYTSWWRPAWTYWSSWTQFPYIPRAPGWI